jgi:hypothetical protein
MVHFLLQSGADVNAADNQGRKPLDMVMKAFKEQVRWSALGASKPGGIIYSLQGCLGLTSPVSCAPTHPLQAVVFEDWDLKDNFGEDWDVGGKEAPNHNQVLRRRAKTCLDLLKGKIKVVAQQ